MIRGVSSHLELCHYNTIKTQYSVGNAFNVNTNSSNCMSNTNNKYNTNNVRAVCDYQDNEDFILFFVNMLVAYYECCRNKRNSISEILYEMNGVMNTLDLAYDVYVYQYKVGPSICFLIYIPTIREVFAASFADRCLHTWIAIRIEPYLEQYLPDCTYSNRKGRGTTGAVLALKDMIGENPNSWIWKFDLQGFFMSVDKRILWAEFEPFIRSVYKGNDLEYLVYATRVALFNAPQENCIRMCDESKWDALPKNKSLFGNPWWLGLPIGDLLSQMMVGFFLKPFIDYLNFLGFVLIVHYVDDFVVLYGDKDYILKCIPLIRTWLIENRGVTLHPRKFYLQHVSKGVRFLGSVLRPNVIFAGERTIKNAFTCRLSKDVNKGIQVVNSYLGFFKWGMTYNLRKKFADRCFKKYKGEVYFGRSYHKMITKKKTEKKRKYKIKGLQVYYANKI